jgi:uncharacterized protein VirK/YbjX
MNHLCFMCGKNEFQAMILKLPLEMVYDNVWAEIQGNVETDEYICLPCVGYQYDWIKTGEAI